MVRPLPPFSSKNLVRETGRVEDRLYSLPLLPQKRSKDGVTSTQRPDPWGSGGSPTGD